MIGTTSHRRRCTNRRRQWRPIDKQLRVGPAALTDIVSTTHTNSATIVNQHSMLTTQCNRNHAHTERNRDAIEVQRCTIALARPRNLFVTN
jgi:hypothetical protein